MLRALEIERTITCGSRLGFGPVATETRLTGDVEIDSRTASTAIRRSEIFFAEKEQALREDVHRLGELVGDLVKEQGGEALFDIVEAARRAAIVHREGDSDALAELQTLLSALAPTAARDFIRAFSTYFEMVNMAEKVHRLRRRRAYLRDTTTPQPMGFEDTLMKLKAAGSS